jgi:hypothetical protein
MRGWLFALYDPNQMRVDDDDNVDWYSKLDAKRS